jgi:glutathione S-transferase
MPKINSRNENVRELQGLHLYHAGWSNCSMRVRMTLEEKQLPWISHHLDTRSGEHITPEYFNINPKGLVPVLVHDGEVWTESCDIIRYLDGVYPNPRLTPTDARQLCRLTEWLSLATEIHVRAVKTYIYASRPDERRRKTPVDLERYRSLQTNKELLAFHARSSSDEGIGEAERVNAERMLHDVFTKLDRYLRDHPWLAGDCFTLADITWVPLHYTLERAGFSFACHENVMTWSRAIADRPCFQKAVVEWFDGPREAETGTITESAE